MHNEKEKNRESQESAKRLKERQAGKPEEDQGVVT
jgi:hypothetical protein